MEQEWLVTLERDAHIGSRQQRALSKLMTIMTMLTIVGALNRMKRENDLTSDAISMYWEIIAELQDGIYDLWRPIENMMWKRKEKNISTLIDKHAT